MNIPDNCLDNLDWYPWNEDDTLDNTPIEIEDVFDHTKCSFCGGELKPSEEEGYEEDIICVDCCYIVNS